MKERKYLPMTREERRKRTERRRAELTEVLSQADSNRTLRKLIADKVLILCGIVGLAIMTMWFMSASVLPLSYFGLIGKADRQIIVNGELEMAHVSAFTAGWNRLTYGASGGQATGKPAVYDMFWTNDPSALKWMGGFGCTVLFLVVLFAFISLIALYSRDLLLISKTMIVITKENRKDQVDDMKKVIRDVRNLYKEESEKDKVVEVVIKPDKKDKKTEEKESEKQVEKVEPELVEEKQESVKEVEEKQVESEHVDYAEFTDEEINALASGEKTEEEIIRERKLK